MGTNRATRYLQGKSDDGASNVGFTELALAVLYQAIKDMRGEGSPHHKDRIGAIVFLASNRAALWLDTAGIEQTSTLLALGWETRAQAMLDNPLARMSGPQRRVLEQGIVALTKCREKDAVPPISSLQEDYRDKLEQEERRPK